jgi:hypothetical protein
MKVVERLSNIGEQWALGSNEKHDVSSAASDSERPNESVGRL